MRNQKTYLGDSVYAHFDGYHVVLTTDNGTGPSNTIYLDEIVSFELIGVIKKYFLNDEVKQENKEGL